MIVIHCMFDSVYRMSFPKYNATKINDLRRLTIYILTCQLLFRNPSSGCCCQLTAVLLPSPTPFPVCIFFFGGDFCNSSRLPRFQQALIFSCGGGNAYINEMSAKPTCLIVASASPQGLSVSFTFHHSVGQKGELTSPAPVTEMW